MKKTANYTKSLFFLALFIICASCEKETNEDTDGPSDAVTKVPVKLETTSSESAVGSLTIDYRVNGYTDVFEDVAHNQIFELEIAHRSDIYHFVGEDPLDGKIDVWVEDKELSSFTLQNPLILKYGHYKDEVIASYSVEVTTETTADVTIQIERGGLYQVDWGDGKFDVVVGDRPFSNNNYTEHFYDQSGTYEVRITTTDLLDVTRVDLQTRNQSRQGTITALQLGNLENLTSLDIGKNTVTEISNVSVSFPKLQYLFLGPGIVEAIDLRNNTQLERLALRGEPYSNIQGLSDLRKLKFLSLRTGEQSIDTSPFTELESLNLFGNTITSVDLSNNKKLTSIWLKDTPLSNLDLSGNTEIEHIIIDNISLPVYDFSSQNKLQHLTIRALVRGEIRYPSNMDNIMSIDYSSFSQIASVMDFTELMLESQNSNPREKVHIKYPNNRYPSLTQQEELAILVDDWDWLIEYRNN